MNFMNSRFMNSCPNGLRGSYVSAHVLLNLLNSRAVLLYAVLIVCVLSCLGQDVEFDFISLFVCFSRMCTRYESTKYKWVGKI